MAGTAGSCGAAESTASKCARWADGEVPRDRTRGITINPLALPTAQPYGPFVANQISGSSSELLQTVGNTHSGSGWLTFGSFSLGGSSIDSATTGIGGVGGYRLYVTFELKDVYRAGTGLPGQEFINGNGTFNDLTQLDFKFYADPGLNTTFSQADANTNTQATVNGNTGDAQGTPFHLHFEFHPVGLLPLGYEDGAVNPYPYLAAWKRLDDISLAYSIPINRYDTLGKTIAQAGEQVEQQHRWQ